MDDVDFVKKSCEKPAPGAERRAGWNSEMANAKGREFVVKDIDESFMAARLATQENPYSRHGMSTDYLFPYTVLRAATPISPPAFR